MKKCRWKVWDGVIPSNLELSASRLILQAEDFARDLALKIAPSKKGEEFFLLCVLLLVIFAH